MSNRFMLNETSYHGHGAILNIVPEIHARGFKKALVCTDPDLMKFGVSTKVTDLLTKNNIPFEVYSNIKANPTIENVLGGVEACKKRSRYHFSNWWRFSYGHRQSHWNYYH